MAKVLTAVGIISRGNRDQSLLLHILALWLFFLQTPNDYCSGAQYLW